MISPSLQEILYFVNNRFISVSVFSLRLRWFIRDLCHKKASVTTIKTKSTRNHQVLQKGGLMMILMDVP